MDKEVAKIFEDALIGAMNKSIELGYITDKQYWQATYQLKRYDRVEVVGEVCGVKSFFLEEMVSRN